MICPNRKPVLDLLAEFKAEIINEVELDHEDDGKHSDESEEFGDVISIRTNDSSMMMDSTTTTNNNTTLDTTITSTSVATGMLLGHLYFLKIPFLFLS